MGKKLARDAAAIQRRGLPHDKKGGDVPQAQSDTQTSSQQAEVSQLERTGSNYQRNLQDAIVDYQPSGFDSLIYFFSVFYYSISYFFLVTETSNIARTIRDRGRIGRKRPSCRPGTDSLNKEKRDLTHRLETMPMDLLDVTSMKKEKRRNPVTLGRDIEIISFTVLERGKTYQTVTLKVKKKCITP